MTILRHELPTNGIIYADVGLSLAELSLDDLPLVNLFLRCLLETGTSKLDQTQLTRRIGTHTGGIRMSSRIALKHPKARRRRHTTTSSTAAAARMHTHDSSKPGLMLVLGVCVCVWVQDGVLGSTTSGLTAHMFVRGKAVASKAGELFELMHEVLTDANLDNQKRVLEMLKEAKAR